MKLKFSAIILGASVLASGAAFSSCAPEEVMIQDEVTLGRCLTPTELSAKVIDGEYIEFNWTKSKGASRFVLELYADETMSELAEEIIIPAEELPYTAALEADMVYYARVKGQSGDGSIGDSHWAVFDRALRTYAIKNSVNPEIVDRTSSSITIKWTADPEVDHIRITPALNADDEYTEFPVGDDAVKAGSIEVTGLLPSVNYTLAVHFKSADRGHVTAWTRPSADGAVEVSTTAALLQAVSDGASKIFVEYHDTAYVTGEMALVASLEIYGKGTTEGAMPVINGRFTVGGGVGSIHCEGLRFEVAGAEAHHITINAANDMEDISVLNCELDGYQRGVYYDNKGASVKRMTYNSVVVSGVAGDGGDCFDIRQSSKMGEISFRNCTLNDGARTWFRIDANAAVETFSMTNCTLNNLCYVDNGNNNGIFNIRAAIASGFILKDNVFLNMNDSKNRCCLIAKNSTSAFPTEISGNFFYNCYGRFFVPQTDPSKLDAAALADAIAAGKARILVNSSCELGKDPCVDSEGGKLNITDAAVMEARAGDPRWFAAYVEVPEDLTLGVTEAVKTWNLTDGKAFRKSADKDMVREGIRFYVKNMPVNFTSSGFAFSGSAVLDENGVPVDGGIGFKVNRPGSVVISAAAGDGHSHLTVSLDGAVNASVAAGEEFSKVTFPSVDGESMIYIYGCNPVTMTFLQWTDDVEVLNTVLASPVLSADKTEVDERADETVTVTWPAVDYAASYKVTFNGKTTAVTETAFSIETKTLSVEEPGGDFTVSVIAVPSADDYIRSESLPSEIVFRVNDVPLPVGGGEIVDPSAITEAYFTELNAASGFAVATVDDGSLLEIGKLTFGGKASFDGNRYKFGGASALVDGIPSNRYVSFKITRHGKISHKVISGSSGDATRKYAVALVTSVGGVRTVRTLFEDYAPVSSGAEPFVTEVTEDMLAGITEAAVVYVYALSNCNVYAVGYEPAQASASGIPSDPSAIEVAEELDLSAMTVTDIAAGTKHLEGKFTLAATSGKSLTVEPAKPRAKFNAKSEVGADGIPTGGYISFKITSPGTVTHKIISSSGSAADRPAKVLLVKNVDGSAVATLLYNEFAPVSSDAAAVGTVITAEHLSDTNETATVYVYGDGGAVNVHSLGFAPAN